MRDNTSVIYILIYFIGLFDFFTYGNEASGFNQKKPESRFISFDPNEKNIDIELDLSIPFLSVPLHNKEDVDGRLPSLVTINKKGLIILGIILATSSFILPLFMKPITHHVNNYRMDDESEGWNVVNTINEILLKNEYITPCVQQIMCSVVTTIKNSENPTSTEKIIDGLVSHRWFEKFANGSMIMDAITTGLEAQKDCDIAYKGCMITQKIIDNTLKALF